MKKWSSPVIEVLDLSDTAYGGNPSMVFDNSFYDEAGALHVNFASEEDTPPTDAIG